MSDSLAVKYRPKTWDEITEQSEVVDILTNQINKNEIKHGYLFTGPAGCGKTTAARIFANEINHGEGKPIEMDAASNNSVEHVRKLIDDAQTKSIDSEYKVYIVDECHMITTQGWNAFLKTLEEPPALSIFILCTTNPEKIPDTILSRVQRYNFKKISTQGIVDRLCHIMTCEEYQRHPGVVAGPGVFEYIARVANGGMRDAITLLDKCLSYTTDLNVDNVAHVLGLMNISLMFDLTKSIHDKDREAVIRTITSIYDSGADLKLFVKQYFDFVLNLNIYYMTSDPKLITIPQSQSLMDIRYTDEFHLALLDFVSELDYMLKYEQNPRIVITAKLILFMEKL